MLKSLNSEGTFLHQWIRNNLDFEQTMEAYLESSSEKLLVREMIFRLNELCSLIFYKCTFEKKEQLQLELIVSIILFVIWWECHENHKAIILGASLWPYCPHENGDYYCNFKARLSKWIVSLREDIQVISDLVSRSLTISLQFKNDHFVFPIPYVILNTKYIKI